jgi:hypothetical protein
MHYKQPVARNFNQLMSFANLSWCDFIKKNILGSVLDVTEVLKKIGIAHECPYEKGEKFNISYTATADLQHCDHRRVKDNKKPIFNIGVGWPDGYYCTKVKFHTKFDTEGLEFKYFNQIKNGDNRAF